MRQGCLSEACRIQTRKNGEASEDFTRQAIYASADVISKHQGLSRARMIGIIERYHTRA